MALDDPLPDPETSRRVVFHVKSRFHAPILKPGWEQARPHHVTLFTNDVEEVLAHQPDVVVACDSQLVSMRRILPEAFTVNTRHGLISKLHAASLAKSADYFCVASPSQVDWFRDRDIAPRKDFWPIGYLQLDPLFRGEVKPVSTGAPAGMPVVLFTPTHGEAISGVPMLGEDPVAAIRPNPNDAFVIIKPHPEIPLRHPEWMDRFRVSAALHENVMLVTDTHASIDAYMAASDIMVSDCSSVMLSYLALDRPLVLLSNQQRFDSPERFDREGPEWQWRSIGEDVEDIANLPAAVINAIGSPGSHAEARETARQHIFGELTDGRTGERLSQNIAALPRADYKPIS
ncbi:MAG: hypothetical protein HOI34_09950 [Rhodospirillaceae bacterium]|nr:hypothetical protein [Rhodospirillaceae bacterium]MBT6204010.1 hypothetical protein [Rhodospirillaceae bacterium]MBT6511585.1 hypothetical protein [Rhodospirillaceae bacterium]MBT7614774.1 hypothetical protein [Rhodospirillaceae bacterium]